MIFVLDINYRLFACINRVKHIMKPKKVADEMFPEGTSAVMEIDDEVSEPSTEG